MFVQVQCKLASCVHVRQVFQAAKVVSFLMWHLRKKSSPDTLVELCVCDTPSDCTQSLAMVLAIAHSQTVSATACVSNKRVRNNRSKAGQATVLPTKGILSRVSLGGVERETAGDASTCDFLVGGDPGRVWCRRYLMVNRERLAPETLPSAIHNVFMVLEWRHGGCCGTRRHLRRSII